MSILSPTEALGLSGAALDARVRRAADLIADPAYRRIAQRLADDSKASDFLYERDGEMQVIPIMLRPLLARAEQVSYVHHVCQQLMDALKSLPALYLADERIRAILRVSPAEDRWLRETWTPAHEKANATYGRLDAVCDFAAASWQDSLKFMEANLSGIGGISYSPLAEQLAMRHLVPALVAHDPGLEIELPRDQRDLFIQALIDHSRSLGRPECRIAFIECKEAEDGINEQLVLKKLFEQQYKLTIVHADPRELTVKDGEVWHDGQIVDVAYRDYEARDIIALEEELGRPMEGMRLLYRENRIVSSAAGDFDHKSGLEVLSDPKLAEEFFSADECRLFRRHVLWTRIVSDRRTTLPHGGEGDLLAYARANRETLVLKPNRAYGGDGVAIGAGTEPADWERLIAEAVAQAEDPDYSWVFQEATRLPVAQFPVLGPDGRVSDEPFYAVMGFAATDHGLGIMCRVSQKQVVNVAQNGGMAAVLIAAMPSTLTLPRRAQARSEAAEAALRQRIGDILHLDNVLGMLEWDEETELPAAAHEERGAQIAMLEAARHQRLTDDALGDLIEDVAAGAGEHPGWTRELTILRDMRAGELTLDEGLVRDYAQARSASQGAWEEARAANDFSLLAPALAETLRLARETALASNPDADPYDTLMDEHEPGMTRARLDSVFADLKPQLLALVPRDVPPSDLGDHLAAHLIAEPDRRAVVRELMAAIGFDFDRGALGIASHPGTSALGFDDVRLSLRPGPHGLAETVLTALHEGGHALYDQGFDPADRGTLLAAAPSAALHEANARLWENHVGRSAAFWRFAAPRLGPMIGGELDAAAMHRAVNRVQLGTRRAGADELTYHLHILLRYELETALVAGTLAVADLPEAWREASRTLLGEAPERDTDGVLLDSHWAAGMFGYFPTYTIGSLYAAQLWEACAKTAELDAAMAKGDFAPVLAFLRRHVHRVGDRQTGEAIITAACGEGLSAAPFFRYVAGKR